MLVATAATPMPPGTRSKLSSSWPAPEELEPSETPIWRKPWAIGLFIAVFVGVGWFVGHSQAPDNDVHGTPMSRALRSVGLGGARFSVTIDSDPPGAWIAIDGKDAARRTPSTVELPPGEHQVTLSMPDLGSVQVAVRGQNGQKLKVNEPLHGSLDVTALDPSLPVKVSLDGQPQGWLPAHIAKLPPGLHELQFNGPNMQPWAQQVSVPIRKTATLVARPMMSPATGVVQVQASMNDDNGTAPLNGAAVFIDGEMRGSTPLKLELPRGPHSLRVMYQGESAPVQVIDLPGGNQRFASFQFGLDSDLPPLKLQGSYAMLPAKRVNTISATLDGLSVRDIRESFLHIKAGDGLWRRVEMTVANGPRGAVVSGVFPNNLFDANGRVQWYVSAATTQGDEFYTEMQRSSR
ncbi:MAG: PEGA domain-containing protein [Candidatus Eisenbacteria bacterium]|nr:PEGA domain-containing protein [Candidatus Eisenbacteria bacterium]